MKFYRVIQHNVYDNWNDDTREYESIEETVGCYTSEEAANKAIFERICLILTEDGFEDNDIDEIISNYLSTCKTWKDRVDNFHRCMVDDGVCEIFKKDPTKFDKDTCSSYVYAIQCDLDESIPSPPPTALF